MPSARTRPCSSRSTAATSGWWVSRPKCRSRTWPPWGSGSAYRSATTWEADASWTCARAGCPTNPTVPEAVAAGADVVTFSADKLLGGPQAGVLLGRRDLVDRIRSHPLYRTVRIDKLDLAGLEATLRLYLDPDRAWRRVPILRTLAASTGKLRLRAERVAGKISAALPSLEVRVLPTEAESGGGSLPGASLPSFAVAVRHPHVDAEAWSARLRCADPPVLSRIHDDTVLLDLRSVLPEQDGELVAAVVAAGRQAAPAR
ncbi:MAG: hypothetical protein QN135_07250 [Armatimonadota bacterium]|nr:hypothetical protein [Armatimonadota bacterium]